MTKQLQSDLSELEKLKGIRTVLSEDERLFISFSYWRKTPCEKAFALLFWTAVAIIYGVMALVIWWM